MARILGLLFAWALLLATPAQAQLLTVGFGPGGFGSAAAGYTGPGDLGLAAINNGGWWGLRAYSSTWADGTHSAIRVVRGADSQKCDVLLTTAGALGNVTSCTGSGSGSAATFCTTDCTIERFYDQSGSGNDWFQSSPSVQAKLVFNVIGGTLPVARVTGTQFYGAVNGGSPVSGGAQPYTFVSVSSRTGNFTSTAVIFASDSNDISAQYTSSASTVGLYGGSATLTATATDSGFHVLQFEYNGGSSVLLVDASAPTTGSAGTTAIVHQWVLGSTSPSFSNFGPTMDFVELGLWPSGFTSASLNTNIHSYWGF